MDTLTYLIILRLLHITCGIFWAGAAIYLAGFVIPAVKASGPDGKRFMQQLTRTNKLPLVMTLTGTLTVISGGLLIWELSGGFQYDWMLSKHGLILNLGALLAIIAYLEGFFVTRPAALALNKLGRQIGTGQPTAEQAEQLSNYNKKIVSATNLTAVLLGGAIIAMSLIRYF